MFPTQWLWDNIFLAVKFSEVRLTSAQCGGFPYMHQFAENLILDDSFNESMKKG